MAHSYQSKPISCQLARSIMGKNFFGIEEWNLFYGAKFSKKQLQNIPEFPWDADILNSPCPFFKGKKIKQTHFAFLGLDKLNGKPLTILKWQKLNPVSGQPRFHAYAPMACFAKENFANRETCRFGWYLMLAKIIPKSTNKTTKKQRVLLPPEYEMPRAIEEITKFFIYFKKNKSLLNPLMCTRCDDPGSLGGRVVFGYIAQALLIAIWYENYPYYSTGITALRKI